MSYDVDLLGKLRQVAEAISYIEKNGRNDHHRYDFVQAVDVTRTVRDELLERKLLVIPGASSAHHLPYGTKGGHLTTVDLTYLVVDTETGASINIPWVGVGADTGGDKGIYKAYTGGFKYALISLFMIPMTNDPEKDQLSSPDPPAQAEHKDDARPAAPRIPLDRAQAILQSATKVGMAKLNLDAEPGTPPEFHPVFKAKLAMLGVTLIGELDVDAAEQVEAFLRAEGEGQGATT